MPFFDNNLWNFNKTKNKSILSRFYFMESFGFTVVNYKCTQLFANVIRLSNKIYASGTIT